MADELQKDGFTVQTGIGGTGVAGVLTNGSGPTVLLRCELDALPLREATGAPFASTATATDASGHQVPVDHACGHDLHMAAMTGMATLMAGHRARGQVLQQNGLAHARLTADHQHSALTGLHVIDQPVEHPALAESVGQP